MAVFKDKANNRWTIDLPVGTVLRVKSESGGKYNLLEPESKLGERTLLAALWEDMAEFWELLWHVVEPQAKAMAEPVTAEKFGELMAAECLVEAQLAFWQEWQAFFHHLQRPDRAAALGRMQRHTAKALEMLRTKLADPAMAEMDRLTEAKMQATLNKSFSKLQESLASIPGD